MLKSLRTAHAAAMAVLLVGSAATLHARAEQGPVEFCVQGGGLVHTIAEARDAGIPLPEILQTLKEHDVPKQFLKIAIAIYSYPALSQDDAATYFVTGCLKAKQI